MSDFLSGIHHGERDYFVQEDEELEPQEEPQREFVQEQQRQHEFVPQQQMEQLIEVHEQKQNEEIVSTETDLFDRLRMMDSRRERPLCLRCLCPRCVCPK